MIKTQKNDKYETNNGASAILLAFLEAKFFWAFCFLFWGKQCDVQIVWQECFVRETAPLPQIFSHKNSPKGLG